MDYVKVQSLIKEIIQKFMLKSARLNRRISNGHPKVDQTNIEKINFGRYKTAKEYAISDRRVKKLKKHACRAKTVQTHPLGKRQNRGTRITGKLLGAPPGKPVRCAAVLAGIHYPNDSAKPCTDKTGRRPR